MALNLLVKFAVANGLLAEIAPTLVYDSEEDTLANYTAINAEVFGDAFATIALAPDSNEVITTQFLMMAALVEIDPTLRSQLHNSLNAFFAVNDGLDALLPLVQNHVFKLLDFIPHLGTTGDDALSADETGDTLLGFGGDDGLYGGSSSDVLIGHVGNDLLYGGSGEDNLFGGLAMTI